MINKHACTKSRHVTNNLDYFCNLEILAKNENCIFPKLVFPKLLQIQKQDIKQLLKHSVYGYDPLHKHGEISMFLTLCTKHGFG